MGLSPSARCAAFASLFCNYPCCSFQAPAGDGKTAVHASLSGKLLQGVLLDSDILWRAEYDKPEEHYRDYFETWLRLCKNISQDHLSFNRWFKENTASATPAINLLDTRQVSLETTAAQVAGWIKLRIGHYGNS